MFGIFKTAWRITIVLAIVLFLGYLVIAHAPSITGYAVADPPIDESLYQDLKSSVPIANKLSSQFPAIFKSMFGNERMNLYITTNNHRTLKIGVITEDMNISTFQIGEIEDPTINVLLTETTARNIMYADNPVDAFNNALKRGEIVYEAIGFIKKLKFGSIGILTRIIDTLSFLLLPEL